MGVGVADVLTSDADGLDDAACADAERGAGSEVAGAGCVAVGVMLGAEDAVGAVVNHAVDGVCVERAVCAFGGGTVRPGQPNYYLWH